MILQDLAWLGKKCIHLYILLAQIPPPDTVTNATRQHWGPHFSTRREEIQLYKISKMKNILNDALEFLNSVREIHLLRVNRSKVGTCYWKTSCAARNGSQVVDSGNTLIGSLVRLVVLWVDYVCKQQRAVGEYASPLIWNQAHEGTIFLPFYACQRRCITVCWAV